jgi:hypothetical protein
MSLYQTLNASPDLTSIQAKALATQYLDEMKENHEFALAISDMEAGPHRKGGGVLDVEEDARREETVEESVSILDL